MQQITRKRNAAPLFVLIITIVVLLMSCVFHNDELKWRKLRRNWTGIERETNFLDVFPIFFDCVALSSTRMLH